MEIVLDILLFALMMWVYHSLKLYFKMQKLQKKMPFEDVSKYSSEQIDRMLAYIEQEDAKKTNKLPVSGSVYQTKNEALFDVNGNKIYKVSCEYNADKRKIILYKDHDRTALMWGMLAHYLPIYLNDLERANKWEELKNLYDELGVKTIKEMQQVHIKKLADLGCEYIVMPDVFIKNHQKLVKFFNKILPENEIEKIRKFYNS